MLFKDRIKNLGEVYPQLARIWINSGDPRRPLKCVWMDESKLQQTESRACTPTEESAGAEVAEDHLMTAA